MKLKINCYIPVARLSVRWVKTSLESVSSEIIWLEASLSWSSMIIFICWTFWSVVLIAEWSPKSPYLWKKSIFFHYDFIFWFYENFKNAINTMGWAKSQPTFCSPKKLLRFQLYFGPKEDVICLVIKDFSKKGSETRFFKT